MEAVRRYHGKQQTRAARPVEESSVTPMSFKDRYERAMDRRPFGKEHRCDRCWFWEAGVFLDDTHPDDRSGTCQRHAPRVQQRMLQKIGDLLGSIAWAIEEQANIEHSSDETDYSFVWQDDHNTGDWPRTFGGEWCGDFKQRPAEQTVEAYADMGHSKKENGPKKKQRRRGKRL